LDVLPVEAQPLHPAEASASISSEPYIGRGVFLGGLSTSTSHVRYAQIRLLEDGETLLAMVKGRAKAHSTRKDGFFKIFEHETDKGGSIWNHYLIVTDRRVILWARGAFKSSTDSLDYSDITGVEQQTGFVYGGIVLKVHGNKANFTEMHKEEAVRVANIIMQNKQKARVSPRSGVLRPDNDPVTQIEKLAGMLAKGLITRDEFEEKKRKLLAQI
jgi:hypothetical protein